MHIEFVETKLFNEFPEKFRNLSCDKYNNAIKTWVNSNY